MCSCIVLTHALAADVEPTFRPPAGGQFPKPVSSSPAALPAAQQWRHDVRCCLRSTGTHEPQEAGRVLGAGQGDAGAVQRQRHAVHGHLRPSGAPLAQSQTVVQGVCLQQPLLSWGLLRAAHDAAWYLMGLVLARPRAATAASEFAIPLPGELNAAQQLVNN